MLSSLPRLTVFLAYASSLVSATALTYRLAANEKTCFYADVAQQGAKVAFYFAVRSLLHTYRLSATGTDTAQKVQSGGSFDIDYTVHSPTDRIVLDGQREKQGDFVFTATEAPGAYSFCFDNNMSALSDKLIDFEITIENEARSAALPAKQGAPAEQTSLLQESIYKISGQLSTITRNQKYFRTRENRNFSTVRSTETRIWRFSVIENVVMVGMAGLQVFVVRFFFQGARKGII